MSVVCRFDLRSTMPSIEHNLRSKIDYRYSIFKKSVSRRIFHKFSQIFVVINEASTLTHPRFEEQSPFPCHDATESAISSSPHFPILSTLMYIRKSIINTYSERVFQDEHFLHFRKFPRPQSRPPSSFKQHPLFSFPNQSIFWTWIENQ